MSDTDIDKITAYLKRKYSKKGIPLPKEVQAYGKDSPTGWKILAINWKAKLLARYSGSAKTEAAQTVLIDNAIKQNK